MAPFNVTRWLAGGVIAGIVLFVAMLAGSPLVREPMLAELEAHSLSVGALPLFLSVLLAAMLVLGLLLVFLNAAVRPRFGTGARAAVIVGVATWVAGPLVVTMMSGLAGLFHGWLLLFGVTYDLVILVAASLVGASIYREPAVTASSTGNPVAI